MFFSLSDYYSIHLILLYLSLFSQNKGRQSDEGLISGSHLNNSKEEDDEERAINSPLNNNLNSNSSNNTVNAMHNVPL
jgi:hypothetical protein